MARLHEYQGKELLSNFGVRIQRGIVAQNAKEAVAAAKQLTSETGTSWHVIKAQVHAGGRGKGGGQTRGATAKGQEKVKEQKGQARRGSSGMEQQSRLGRGRLGARRFG